MNHTERLHRELSDKAFKDHGITELSRSGVYRSWRCAKPDSRIYSFVITTIPGSIIVIGDIGELIVSRMFDMLPWCRGSVNSTDYFAEKVPHAIPTKEFSRDKLREWIRDRMADSEFSKHHELLEKTLRRADDLGADWFYEELWPVWVDEDPPDWKDWRSNFLWCRDAIRWFVMNHDEEPIYG